MSSSIVTLHVPVYCVIINASIRPYQPNLKIHDVHVLRKHMLFDIEKKLLLLQLSGENSVLASLSCRPGYRQITEIQRLDILKQVHVLLTCHIVLDVMND